MICGFLSEKENDWLDFETEPGIIIKENYEAIYEVRKTANDELQITKCMSHFIGRVNLHLC